jgi:hypothetical protein
VVRYECLNKYVSSSLSYIFFLFLEEKEKINDSFKEKFSEVFFTSRFHIHIKFTGGIM